MRASGLAEVGVGQLRLAWSCKESQQERLPGVGDACAGPQVMNWCQPRGGRLRKLW